MVMMTLRKHWQLVEGNSRNLSKECAASVERKGTRVLTVGNWKRTKIRDLRTIIAITRKRLMQLSNPSPSQARKMKVTSSAITASQQDMKSLTAQNSRKRKKGKQQRLHPLQMKLQILCYRSPHQMKLSMKELVTWMMISLTPFMHQMKKNWCLT